MYRAIPFSRGTDGRLPLHNMRPIPVGTRRLSILILADALAVLASAALASRLPLVPLRRLDVVATAAPFLPNPGTILGLVAVTLVAYVGGRHRAGQSFLDDTRCVALACLCGVGVVVLFGLILDDLTQRRSMLVALLYLPGIAVVLKVPTRPLLRLSGAAALPVMIATPGGSVQSDAIDRRFHPVGRLALSPSPFGPTEPSLRSLLVGHGAEALMIVANAGDRDALALARRAVLEKVPVHLTLRLSDPVAQTARCKVAVGSRDLVISSGRGLMASAAYATKTVIDLSMAALLLVLLTPPMLLIAALIRRDGGRALFVHQRIGLHGRSFGCLKFRTMVRDAQTRLEDLLARDAASADEWANTHKLRNDPRITRIGAFLRRTSLDELPQLINVLRREMSLVGPRPIEAVEAAHYGDLFPCYCAVRPGITGLWQVSGRSNTTYERRVRLDVDYVTGWSLFVDLRILLKTIWIVMRCEGAC